VDEAVLRIILQDATSAATGAVRTAGAGSSAPTSAGASTLTSSGGIELARLNTTIQGLSESFKKANVPVVDILTNLYNLQVESKNQERSLFAVLEDTKQAVRATEGAIRRFGIGGMGYDPVVSLLRSIAADVNILRMGSATPLAVPPQEKQKEYGVFDRLAQWIYRGAPVTPNIPPTDWAGVLVQPIVSLSQSIGKQVSDLLGRDTLTREELDVASRQSKDLLLNPALTPHDPLGHQPQHVLLGPAPPQPRPFEEPEPLSATAARAERIAEQTERSKIIADALSRTVPMSAPLAEEGPFAPNATQPLQPTSTVGAGTSEEPGTYPLQPKEELVPLASQWEESYRSRHPHGPKKPRIEIQSHEGLATRFPLSAQREPAEVPVGMGTPVAPVQPEPEEPGPWWEAVAKGSTSLLPKTPPLVTDISGPIEIEVAGMPVVLTSLDTIIDLLRGRGPPASVTPEGPPPSLLGGEKETYRSSHPSIPSQVGPIKTVVSPQVAVPEESPAGVSQVPAGTATSGEPALIGKPWLFEGLRGLEEGEETEATIPPEVSGPVLEEESSVIADWPSHLDRVRSPRQPSDSKLWESWKPPHHSSGWNTKRSNIQEMIDAGFRSLEEGRGPITNDEYQRYVAWRKDRGLVPPGFARGGRVPGHPGGPSGTDTVPAWLTPGEVVVPRDVAQVHRDDLKSIGVEHLAQGGYVHHLGIGGVIGSVPGTAMFAASPDTDPSVPIAKLGEAASQAGQMMMATVPPLGMLMVGAGEAGKSLAGLMQSINKTAERYGEYSPEIASAQAMAEVRQTMGDIRRGQEMGGQLAAYVKAQSDLQQTLEDIKSKLLSAFLPLITQIVEVLNTWFGTVVDDSNPPPNDPTNLLLRDWRFTEPGQMSGTRPGFVPEE
jgi:hypothetical protein